MDKDKPIDRKDNNLENKKEDYKDSNGNPENFIEDITDPGATDIFKEAFYAEGEALEEEALRSSFVEDEEKKEALRLRILEAAGRSTADTAAEDRSVVDDAVVGRSTTDAAFDGREIDATAENAVLEHKAALENQSNDTVANKAVVRETATESAPGETMTVSEIPVRNNDTVKASEEDVKKKKNRRLAPFMRWAAVLALVCVGVLGVSVTGQAKGSGLWNSIQWLIGGETRWENENNGEDRTFTNPEEEKAIGEIEKKLDIKLPKFFYWPDNLIFQDVCIFEEARSYLLTYTDTENTIYFEGCKGDSNTSSNGVWQGDGMVEQIKYDDIVYTITEIKSDENENYYYVGWSAGENKYSLSGMKNLDQLIMILKNIKN